MEGMGKLIWMRIIYKAPPETVHGGNKSTCKVYLFTRHMKIKLAKKLPWKKLLAIYVNI